MTHTSTRRKASNPAMTMRLAAACSDPRHHRALVLAANAGLVACAAAEPFTPSLALHLALLPINAWRLLSALRQGSPSVPAADESRRTDVAIARMKAESMRSPAYDARVTLQTVRLEPRVAL